MKFKTVKYKGNTYTMPVPESDMEIPFGVARRIRNLKTEEEQASELMFSLLEMFLTGIELEKWDNLAPEEIQGVMDAFEEDAKAAGEASPLKD